jgi:hypothetical protein
LEWEETRIKQEREELERRVIEERKAELLSQHAEVLRNFNPKAASIYRP